MLTARSAARLLPQPIRTRAADFVVDQFHTLYYTVRGKQTWGDTTFLGVRVLKNPLDLWIYQEMLFELRPDLIIETGTAFGGSALYLATLCDVLDSGRIVTIDIKQRDVPPPEHPRITYILNSSVDSAVAGRVRDMAKDAETVLVILDSDHRRDHVVKELNLYAPLVTPGSYIVVEDTNVNGHPVSARYGPGPMEAVDAFLAQDDRFVVDESREKFIFTFNPRGFLKRIG